MNQQILETICKELGFKDFGSAAVVKVTTLPNNEKIETFITFKDTTQLYCQSFLRRGVDTTDFGKRRRAAKNLVLFDLADPECLEKLKQHLEMVEKLFRQTLKIPGPGRPVE